MKKRFIIFLLLFSPIFLFSTPYSKISLLNGLTFYYFPSTGNSSKISILLKRSIFEDLDFKSGIRDITFEILKEDLEDSLSKIAEVKKINFSGDSMGVEIDINVENKGIPVLFLILKNTFSDFRFGEDVFKRVKDRLSLRILNKSEDPFLRLDRICRKNFYLCGDCGILNDYRVLEEITPYDVYRYSKAFLNPASITILFKGKIKGVKPYIFASRYFGLLIKKRKKKYSLIKNLKRKREIFVGNSDLSLLYFELPSINSDDYIFSKVFEIFFLKEFKKKFKPIRLKRVFLPDSQIVEIFLDNFDKKDLFKFLENFELDGVMLSYSKEKFKEELKHIKKDDFLFIKYCKKMGITPFILKSMMDYTDSIRFEDMKYIQEKYFSIKNFYFIFAEGKNGKK